MPIAATFLIIQIISMGECSSLTQTLMQIRCSTRPVILNTMATQYTCSLNGVRGSQWLVQWRCHCSHMLILIYFPWLETVLIILSMAGLFPDRPCMMLSSPFRLQDFECDPDPPQWRGEAGSLPTPKANPSLNFAGFGGKDPLGLFFQTSGKSAFSLGRGWGWDWGCLLGRTLQILKHWFSAQGGLPQGGHLSMSGGIFGYHNLEDGGRGATSI